MVSSPEHNDNSAMNDGETRGLGRLGRALARSRDSLLGGIQGLFASRPSIDASTLEELEDVLLSADVGVAASQRILDDLRRRLNAGDAQDSNAVLTCLQQSLHDILKPVEVPLPLPHAGPGPFVILMVGVNGSGKTTTIGKLAARLRTDGHSVMLAAGDTFRAAAVEQLQHWGKRIDVPVIAQAPGADSASVIFDAVSAAKARSTDILIADTAGRLHTHRNLMEELTKVERVIKKVDPSAPHETLLVVDGGTGQNALRQAQQFNEAVTLSGLAVTKLDGTAKGGVAVALAQEMALPIRFIGVGEDVHDLRDFVADDFIGALLAS